MQFLLFNLFLKGIFGSDLKDPLQAPCFIDFSVLGKHPLKQVPRGTALPDEEGLLWVSLIIFNKAKVGKVPC